MTETFEDSQHYLPEPYYTDDHVTIYHADCREILPYLGNVDLVITSPPYNNLKVVEQYSGW